MNPGLLVLCLLSVVLALSGCATAGLGLVGPLAGSVTAIVDRSVERTLPADLSTTWGATADALARMAVRIEETDKAGAKWHLTGTGGATTVHGTLEGVTAGMTKVSVRVEVGGLFADKDTGNELLNQIAASLVSLAGRGQRDGTTSNADASGERLRLLQREIQQLGTKIEPARKAPPPTARPEVPPVATVSPTPIIVIPASAGVATVPAPDIPLARQAADDILAAPMRSVETLRPVEALRIRPVGQ